MHLRPLTQEDVPACLALATGRDWLPEERKWRLLLEVGRGFALEAPEGGLAGTVLTTSWDGRAAAIGMMLVGAAHGGRGLGRRLMEHALAHLGPVPTLLYATALGRPLYEKLGFVEVDTLVKHQGLVRGLPARPLPAGPLPAGLTVRALVREDLAAVAALDAEAFGAPRRPLLEGLWQASGRACVAERGGRRVGYGLLWPSLDVRLVGPLVAPNDAVAQALLTALLVGQQHVVRLDVPARFTRVSDWLVALGLTRHPPAPMMVLHADRPPGRREHLYAVSMMAAG